MKCQWREKGSTSVHRIRYVCDRCQAIVVIPCQSLRLRFEGEIAQVFDLLADCGTSKEDAELAFRKAMRYGTDKMIAILKEEEAQKKKKAMTSEDKPTPKSFAEKIDSYEKEHEIWVKAGKPTRNRRRRAQLYSICAMCEHYTGKTCEICGCMINLTPGLNKLYWATTKCPNDPPKWVAEEPKKEESDPEEAALVPDAALNKPPRKTGGCGCR